MLARRWIGTPYVHQSARRGSGTDCLGLVRGVWRELYTQEPEAIPPYSRDWSEPQGEERLWRACSKYLLSRADGRAAVGDVILFRMRSGAVAKHLGIQVNVGPTPSFVHAYAGHGVVENPLSNPWQRRIVARFAFPQENA